MKGLFNSKASKNSCDLSSNIEEFENISGKVQEI